MLKIYLLGHFRLSTAGQSLRFSVLPKTVPLWAYLLLHRNSFIPRDSLSFTLWPDIPESDARANLRRHLHDLRRALPPEPAGNPWLLSDGAGLQWNTATPYQLDVAEFERLSQTPDRIAEAITFYTGELLQNSYEDWIIFERQRLHNLYIANLNKLILRCCNQYDYRQAIVYARQIIALDPFHEDILRQLMTMRYQSGDRAGALQEYQVFEHRLREEMDIEPMPETSNLYKAIATNKLPLADHPSPATEPVSVGVTTPPTAVLPTPPPHNLPAQLTAFIGREKEMAALCKLIGTAESPTRLLTLTGAGGSGKTRLSLEVAHYLWQNQPQLFPDGIFFVGLASVTESDLTLPTIAINLGLKESGHSPLLESLKIHLKNRHMLLLLDNFEQLLESLPVVIELLSAAPGLRILVTSRVVLQVYGEQEFPVPPLRLPDPANLPPADELLNYAAVSLFVERTRAVKPDFKLTNDNAAVVAEICLELDGLPLTIELAAARSKLFTPAAILAQLSNRLKFLTGQTRNLAARQQTLRATIDWSYNLLDDGEKRLFAYLALFAGEFTLKVAEMGAGNHLLPDEPTSLAVVDGLASLVNKSMVRQIPPEDDEEPRFRLLFTIREYALAKLDEDPAAADLRQHHASFFLNLAEEARTELHGRAQAVWLKRLNAADNDLRAALIWSLDEASGETGDKTAVRLAIALVTFWQLRGRIEEGRMWLNRTLALATPIPVELHLSLLNSAGWLAQLQGEYTVAERFHEDALAIARSQEDTRLVSRTLQFLGTASGRQGDFARAKVIISECLDLQRQEGAAPARLIPLITNLAIVTKRLGDYEQAFILLEESLSLAQGAGTPLQAATALANLGSLALLQGNQAQAAVYHRESLTIRHRLDDQIGIKNSLGNMADLAAAVGDLLRSLRLYAAAEALNRTLNVPRTEAEQIDYNHNLATIKQHIDEAAFARAWAEGHALLLNEAVAYALELEVVG